MGTKVPSQPWVCIASRRVDYLAVRDGRIARRSEVGKWGCGILRSLHLMLVAFPNCADGVVLYSGVHSRLPERRLTFMPLYFASAVGHPRPDIV